MIVDNWKDKSLWIEMGIVVKLLLSSTGRVPNLSILTTSVENAQRLDNISLFYF